MTSLTLDETKLISRTDPTQLYTGLVQIGKGYGFFSSFSSSFKLLEFAIVAQV
jgi:hypothetical protein